MSNKDSHNLARYLELLKRITFELGQAHDLALHLKLSFKRTSRLKRAAREIYDEKNEAKEQKIGRAEST